jgi:hypothetical protein
VTKWITVSEEGMVQVQGAIKHLSKSLQGPKRHLCALVMTPLQRRVLKSMETRWMPGAQSENLFKRTGNTMRYLSAQPFDWGADSVSWGAKPDTPEGRRLGFLEHGGTITPKNGRALAIPLPAALTAAGALRSELNSPGGLRGCGVQMFVMQRQSRAPLLVQWAKGYKALTPLFVLKPSVFINAHPTFKNAVEGSEAEINAALSPANLTAVLEGDK